MLFLVVCHEVGNEIKFQHILVISRCVVGDNLKQLVNPLTCRLVLVL